MGIWGRAQSQEVQARREDHLGLTEGSQAPESLQKNPGGLPCHGAGGEGQPEGEAGQGSGPLGPALLPCPVPPSEY